MLLLHQPFEPIFPEKLNRMLRPDGPISKAEVISWTILVTPPADALGVFRMKWEVGHAFAYCNAGRGRFEPGFPGFRLRNHDRFASDISHGSSLPQLCWDEYRQDWGKGWLIGHCINERGH
jgi:hypothetical protein